MHRIVRGLARFGLFVSTFVFASCREEASLLPSRLDWAAEDSARIAWLSAEGRALEASSVVAWFPRDSIPEAEMERLVQLLDQAVPALQQFIGGPYPWQRHRDEKITYYFAAGRFVSHTRGGAVLIPAWRINDGSAPCLHETLHVLLTGPAPFYPEEFADTLVANRMASALPLWLIEGFPDFVAQAVAKALGITEGDIFRVGSSAAVDSTCAARLGSARREEILPYIGAAGRPEALFTSGRQEVAPIFYACAYSFTRFLVQQTDAPFIASLFPDIPSGRVAERVYEHAGRTLPALRAEWLGVSAAVEQANRL